MLSSKEKFDRMIQLIPPKNREDIPVFPMMVGSCGNLTGITQREMMENEDKWLEALDRSFDLIGKPDVSMVACPADSVFTMPLAARIPGRELGDNEMYQFIEKPQFEPEEYERIMKMGWNAWFSEYLMRIQNPPMKKPEELWMRWGKVGANFQKVIDHLEAEGIVPIFHTADQPIYDSLSLIRSMMEFTCDLYDDADQIMDIVKKYQPEKDQANIQMLKQNGGTRIGIFAMRSSSTFISPDMFHELIWPNLRDSIKRYAEAGIVSVIHADANWIPMLKYFTEVPKRSCHIELDGASDIFEAYDILGGYQSIAGDVPSTMFAMGTPDEVSEYCEKLITEIGMKGGFMLGSGCEIPPNAKPECIKAMMDSVKR